MVADATAAFYEGALPKYAQGALVDLGCGRVPLYAAYKARVMSITCVDWANTLHPNPHLDLEQDLNGPIALPDASFDTVILSDVLEHIRKPEQLVGEIFRVLRPGGHVLLNVPFYHGLHERPHDYFRYTEYALRSMAEDAGFTVVHLEATGGAPEILADVLSKTMLSVPLIGRFKARFVQAFTGWFVRGRWGKRVSTRSWARLSAGLRGGAAQALRTVRLSWKHSNRTAAVGASCRSPGSGSGPVRPCRPLAAGWRRR